MRIKLQSRYVLVPIVFIALLFCVKGVLAQTLTLYDAIQQALENNQTILYNAEQRLESAREQWSATEASYRKTLDADLSILRQYSRNQSALSPEEGSFTTTTLSQVFPGFRLRQTFLTPLGGRLTASAALAATVDGFSSPTFQNNMRISLSLSQPLSAAGVASGHADIVQAIENFKLAGHDYALRREMVALSVMDSYFQVWQADRSLEQSERDSVSSDRLWKLAKLKLKSGMIAESEIMNLEVQYRLAVDGLEQTRNNLQTQLIFFRRLLGDSIKSRINLSPEIPFDSLTISLEQAIETARNNRIEIEQAEIGLTLTELGIAQTASIFSPTLRLDVAYNINSMRENSVLRALTSGPNYGLNMRTTLSIPIFDGGRNAAQVEVARHSLAIQKKNLKLLKEDIAIDIENRFRTLQLDQRRFHSLSLSLNVAEEALKIAELKFQTGQISSTEIENIRDRYNSADNTLNSVRISNIIESARLAQAMGELFDWVDRLRE